MESSTSQDGSSSSLDVATASSDTDGDDTDGDEPNSDFDEEIAMIRRCKKTTRAERTNNMCE